MRKNAAPITLPPLTFDNQRGNCFGADQRMFFPGKTSTMTKDAKQLCDSCEVKDPCRLYAIDNPTVHGIWGGTTPDERVKIRRRVNYVRGIA